MQYAVLLSEGVQSQDMAPCRTRAANPEANPVSSDTALPSREIPDTLRLLLTNRTGLLVCQSGFSLHNAAMKSREPVRFNRHNGCVLNRYDHEWLSMVAFETVTRQLSFNHWTGFLSAADSFIQTTDWACPMPLLADSMVERTACREPWTSGPVPCPNCSAGTLLPGNHDWRTVIARFSGPTVRNLELGSNNLLMIPNSVAES